ncbi:YceI family protein [Kerstersia gyiorum]|jgi:polyisoprenoid-binding protein YceI|uniref:Lipid/polyisoprenoid-binding YceI-like domain-containing protein n=1 Tax=Kerstersia gyiorum TaxID=206506 RepID=A0A171KRR1_9BURK|nr:YceI family protein [Kerstersia gyiorum]AZV92575.1 YceI family protein [Bordetella sp. J329]MCO7641064.1 YceI family protein [Pseudomonas sp. S 311-6]KKO71578.1 hypothetical protein AAV32_10305 [Kerstersia gyiorum]MCH4271940.1 YceI family protein [Kerstersia gyiorum]MCI1230244.1 YceI family protein [Kerstersia gyiorum]
MKTLIAAAVAALLPWHAMAASYQDVDTGKSQIRFHYSQMGVAMDGDFPRFAGKIDFDPAKPEQGSASVEVFLDSVDTGTDEGNDEVRTESWLDVSGHPIASFATTAIKAVGDGAYEASGTLTIKGKSQPVTIPARFTEKDGLGIFEGRFDITRGDYAIGEGPWAATDIVAAQVGISFSLATRPAP